jgi:hypothetical protein
MHRKRLRNWCALHHLEELLGGEKSGRCHRYCRVGVAEPGITNLGPNYVIVIR